MRQSFSADRTSDGPCSAAAPASRSSVAWSAPRSCSLSHRTCFGEPGRTKNASTPTTTAGTASATNMNRQPSRPHRPCPCSISSADRGAPSTTATGIAMRKSATMRARTGAGNQSVSR